MHKTRIVLRSFFICLCIVIATPLYAQSTITALNISFEEDAFDFNIGLSEATEYNVSSLIKPGHLIIEISNASADQTNFPKNLPSELINKISSRYKGSTLYIDIKLKRRLDLFSYDVFTAENNGETLVIHAQLIKDPDANQPRGKTSDTAFTVKPLNNAQVTSVALQESEYASEFTLNLNRMVEYNFNYNQRKQQAIIEVNKTFGASRINSMKLNDHIFSQIASKELDNGNLQITLTFSFNAELSHNIQRATENNEAQLVVRALDRPKPDSKITAHPLAVAKKPATAAPDKITVTPKTTPHTSIIIGELIAPLYVDGELTQEILTTLYMPPSQSVVLREDALGFIQEFLHPSVYYRIKNETSNQESISFLQLATYGIIMSYDSKAIELHARTQPEIRKTRHYNLSSRIQQQPADIEAAIQPSDFSAALEFRIASRTIDDINILSAQTDLLMNYNKWVFLHNYGYNSTRASPWARRGTRLVRDWEDKRYRLSLGDNYPSGFGLMGTPLLSGIQFGNAFSVQPYFLSQPFSNYTFFLENDSHVKLYTNGSPRADMNLKAGLHNMYDFPLIDGINDVTLEITDSFGRTEMLSFATPHNQSLLRQGIIDYKVTMGIPRTQTSNGGIQYSGNPAITSYLRKGIKSTLTLGGHAETDNTVYAAGLTSTISTMQGNIFTDISTSKISNGKSDTAFQLNYSYLRKNWNIATGLLFTGRHYSRINQPARFDSPHNTWNIHINLPRYKQWSTKISLRRTERWNALTYQRNLLGFTRVILKDWGLNINFISERSNTITDSGATFDVYWSPRNNNTRASITHSSIEQRSAYEFSYARPSELGILINSQFIQTPTSDITSLSIKDNNNFFDLNLASISTQNTDSTASVDNTIAMGSALVYADGAVAISRPLLGLPVAMLHGLPSLGKNHVGIIRGVGSQTSSYLNGAGKRVILPQLTPYYINQINLDVDDIPIDVQLDQQQFFIKSNLFSVTTVDIGMQGETYLYGTLLDEHGLPVSYALGKIKPITTDKHQLEIDFFTDNNGYFEAADLSSGHYSIIFDALKLKGTIIIPDKHFGRLDTGTLKLEKYHNE